MDCQEKFIFKDGINQAHLDFYEKYGFIHFKEFFTATQIKNTLEAIESLQNDWISKGLEKVNGIPIKYGKDENGKKVIHRFAFASLHNEYLHNFIQDPRIDALKYFIGSESRIAENEKDGLVINHYVNTGESNY